MLGFSAWPSFLTKFSGILHIWLVTRINPDHNQLLLHFHVSRCSHRKAMTGWELKWDSEPLDTGFHFLVKIQDYSFCTNSSVLQKQENWSCSHIPSLQPQSVTKCCLQHTSSRTGWSWVSMEIPGEGHNWGGCERFHTWGRRLICKSLLEFSSLVGELHRNLFLSQRSTSLDLADSLGASFSCMGFVSWEKRTRVEGMGNCCVSWACAKIAGFQCCCYFNYSNKQET